MTSRRHDPTYCSWRKMRERCKNPNCSRWRWYGGRGIGICARWGSFENFIADMGPRPKGRTLDRIDANGDYEPGNCRWATQLQQVRNRRDTIIVRVGDRVLPLREACEEAGVTFHQVYWRARQQGMSIDDAFAMTCAFSLLPESAGMPRANLQDASRASPVQSEGAASFRRTVPT